MLRKSLMAIGFSLCATSAMATDVVTWTDADGVTHFGNAQFAPAGKGARVDMQPANGMDVPDASSVKNRVTGQPNITVLDRKVVKNPRGFRGFSKRSRRGTNYRH